MKYYSAIKKDKIMPYAATWMQQEIFILSEVRHRRKTIICYHLHVESNKMIEKNLFIKQKETHKFEKKSYHYHKWNHCGEGRIPRVGVTYTHYCMKYVINKNPLYSTGKSTQ